jgi:hypothetical protein
MALTRIEHWDIQSFHMFLLERAQQPFQWQDNDCCTFVADAVKAITGTDIASEFRGRYTTKAGAFRAIKTITGGSTVADAVAHCAAKYGLQELKNPLSAQRGDMVLVQEGEEQIAGVVHLNGRHIVVVGEQGLMTKSISSVRRAWRV